MSEIKESDWKIFRQVSRDALERFCKQILSEIEQINSDSTKSSHQKYLDIYQVIHERDEEMALLFDDLRRSNALVHLLALKSRNLLTKDEFSRFSQETQTIMASWLEDQSA